MENAGYEMNTTADELRQGSGIYSVKGRWLSLLPFFCSNAFILNTSPEAGILLIDCCGGGSGETIAAAMKQFGLDPGKITGIAITHWHGDHTGSLAEIISIAASHGAGEIKVFMHREDCAVYKSGKGGFVRFHPFFRIPFYVRPGKMPDEGLFSFVEFDEAGDNPLKPWGLEIVHVPGHTPGNTAYYHSESGSMFCGSGIAMIDEDTAGIMPVYCDRRQQVESAKKLMSMEFNYLYPAHINIRKDPIPLSKRIPLDGSVSLKNRARGILPLFRYGR